MTRNKLFGSINYLIKVIRIKLSIFCADLLLLYSKYKKEFGTKYKKFKSYYSQQNIPRLISGNSSFYINRDEPKIARIKRTTKAVKQYKRIIKKIGE